MVKSFIPGNPWYLVKSFTGIAVTNVMIPCTMYMTPRSWYLDTWWPSSSLISLLPMWRYLVLWYQKIFFFHWPQSHPKVSYFWYIPQLSTNVRLLILDALLDTCYNCTLIPWTISSFSWKLKSMFFWKLKWYTHNKFLQIVHIAAKAGKCSNLKCVNFWLLNPGFR